jgi:DNA-binding transcriptional regulator YiaG
MPNIGAILKNEISRICRREIRRQVQPVRKASAGFRHDIAALKRQAQELQRLAATLAKRAPPAAVDQAPASAERPLRFVAKGLRSLRNRLGLSASDLAKLMGVSDQSVYNWELKKTTPRREQLATLAAIRSLGKREAQQRLETLKEPKRRKTAKKKAAKKKA